MKTPKSEIVIFQTKDGKQVVEVHLKSETLWLTQRQMSELFETSTDNIGLHLSNIFADEELEEDSTTEDFSVVQNEGKRKVSRTIKHYNLDAILSVGYRVNSKRGVQFRQWSSSVLREHLTQGFTLNRQRFEKNAAELQAALELISKAAKSPELSLDAGRGLVDIVTRYAQTFLLLQRYDEGLLAEPSSQKGGKLQTVKEARASLGGLKKDLISRGEATELFAKEREDGLAALLGNLEQTVFGDPAYPTIESKAAHLLYFVVKNHPFIDGNKRSAAFLFVDFLNRNKRLIGRDGQPIINDIGLAALTLLVAESLPANKESMIKLILNMLSLKMT